MLVGLGILVSLSGRVPWLGRLPGDITIRRDGLTIYLPLATSLLVSIGLTLVLYLFRR